MQPRIWICTQQPDETALRKASNICMPQIEHAVLGALRARGSVTEYRRCSALLVQPLP